MEYIHIFIRNMFWVHNIFLSNNDCWKVPNVIQASLWNKEELNSLTGEKC